MVVRKGDGNSTVANFIALLVIHKMVLIISGFQQNVKLIWFSQLNGKRCVIS